MELKKYNLLFLFLLILLGNANSQERLKSDGEIPILAWYSIPANETTIERYQEMKEAGINHSLSFFSNIDEMQKALDVAEKAGVKMLVACPELKKEPEKTVNRFKNLAIPINLNLSCCNYLPVTTSTLFKVLLKAKGDLYS